MVGMSSLLTEETDLSPKQRESIQMINTSGELLLAIVNDVLDYSKLESGNIEIVLKRSNLQEVLSSAIHSMNLKAEASNNVRIRTYYDPNVPEFISTDMRRLSQVLYNLIGNALKFSKDGGVVEFVVSVCRAESHATEKGTEKGSQQNPQNGSSHGCNEGAKYSPPRIYRDEPLPSLDQNSYVIRFVVKDYGRGINSDDFPKIFQPFLQADHATEILYGGTGLGLSITSRLVHGLGGAIAVESVEGEWSKFTVDLPANADDDCPTDTEALSAGLQGASVLLIGCEAGEQERMVDIFSSLRVDCVCFSDLVQMRNQWSTSPLPENQIRIFVVREDVFDAQAFGLVSSQTKSVLLTFGPGFRCAQNARHHYRSLTQILPSILLSDMARYVQEVLTDLIRSSVRNHASSVCSSRDLSQARLRSMRFLIAEDNLVNQKVLSRILTRLGVENVVVVDNGAAAVEREAVEAFHICFMDMQMPVMSGTEATKRIVGRSEEGSHPRAKVIFCTAHAMDHFEEECLNAGGVGFLTKPCTVQGVQECLQKVLLPESHPQVQQRHSTKTTNTENLS